jgi:hypothetical protein
MWWRFPDCSRRAELRIAEPAGFAGAVIAPSSVMVELLKLDPTDPRTQ